MAEIVGVVSAGIGLAAFVVQVSGNIGRLRETPDSVQNKAAPEVELLTGRLEFLRQILLSLDDFQGHKIVDLAIGHCSKLTAVRKARDLKDEVAAASEKVDFIITELNCALTRDLHQIVATNLPATAAALALSSPPQKTSVPPPSETEMATQSHLTSSASTTSEQPYIDLSNGRTPRENPKLCCKALPLLMSSHSHYLTAVLGFRVYPTCHCSEALRLSKMYRTTVSLELTVMLD
ncbi:hypothetical protein BJX66DRAFT_335031 [Aspergillus keveii]|uniref:Fungal N-terminal domain-containing protein n=1 Tax=Aspergillus keveii TaxID=714993 RepID=A0ABR4GEE2_9EURO